MLPAFLIAQGGGRSVEEARDFYGPIAVVDLGDRRILVHGNTIQGQEFLDPGRRTELTGYYEPRSGIARLINAMKDRAAPTRERMDGVVLGLGAGSMACFGDPGLRLSFVEIDPNMQRIADEQFGFMTACGNPPVAIGDGRIAISERAPDSLDLIVMDAFSSDTIPAHLVTAEAVGMYVRKLREGGAIAVHISNRYVDLAPVVAASASANGLNAYILRSRTELGASDWTVATADPELGARLVAGGWERLPPRPDALWRDDRWSLLRRLKPLTF